MRRLESSALEHRPLRQEDADALYRNHPDVPRNHLAGCPSCGKNNGYGIDTTSTPASARRTTICAGTTSTGIPVPAGL